MVAIGLRLLGSTGEGRKDCTEKEEKEKERDKTNKKDREIKKIRINNIHPKMQGQPKLMRTSWGQRQERRKRKLTSSHQHAHIATLSQNLVTQIEAGGRRQIFSTLTIIFCIARTISKHDQTIYMKVQQKRTRHALAERPRRSRRSGECGNKEIGELACASVSFFSIAQAVLAQVMTSRSKQRSERGQKRKRTEEKDLGRLVESKSWKELTIGFTGRFTHILHLLSLVWKFIEFLPFFLFSRHCVQIFQICPMSQAAIRKLFIGGNWKCNMKVCFSLFPLSLSLHSLLSFLPYLSRLLVLLPHFLLFFPFLFFLSLLLFTVSFLLLPSLIFFLSFLICGFPAGLCEEISQCARVSFLS